MPDEVTCVDVQGNEPTRSQGASSVGLGASFLEGIVDEPLELSVKILIRVDAVGLKEPAEAAAWAASRQTIHDGFSLVPR
jgi:hypothetical protein